MRYLFVVQGEGRGHLTQAITLEKLLTSHGHEVAGVLVGKSPARKLPDFFMNNINAPIKDFQTVNFEQSRSGRKPSIARTAWVNLLRLPKTIKSIRFLNREIRESGADVVVNFYETLVGLTYLFCGIKTRQISIGHQYLLMHKDFGISKRKHPGIITLNFFSRITSFGVSKRLALSFRQMEPDSRHRIKVVPPLLRPEVMSLKPVKGDYVLGYMLNSGFSKDVMEWHRSHPETELRFFWDKWSEGRIKKVDDTLSFYLIDDKEFLRQMEGCAMYASTAGFESVCEAMYLGKPILMVPSHIEQEINALDAKRNGAGISADSFNDISALLEFSRTFEPSKVFVQWASSARDVILAELES